MRTAINLFFLLLCFNLSLGMFHDSTLPAQASGTGSISGKTLWNIDFATFPGDFRQELLNRAFQFEKAMKNDDKIIISLDNQRLSISTIKPAFGLMVKKDLNIEQAKWVEIDWGVEQYPEKADWSKGKNREAVMIYFFFGEPVDADRFYLPDSPYFIGLFLGQHEDPLTPYKGKSYTRTGRYVCLGNPKPGQAITSRFNLAAAYKDYYRTSSVPPVTGIAIEVDTDTLANGSSSSFIQRISLTKADNT